MLISTRKGEMPGNPEFGCAIWDLQFQTIVDQRKWEDTVVSSLTNAIKEFEPRLMNVRVGVTLSEIEVSRSFKRHPEVKKQATIRVAAHLVHSREQFNFMTNVFVSPLAK